MPASHIISIHIGGTGVNQAAPLWDQMCLEHNINASSGEPLAGAPPLVGDHKEVMFSETCNGRFQPRAILVDIDADDINQLRRSPQGSLFNPSQFLSNVKCTGTGGLFAGAYKDGDVHQCLDDATMDALRKEVERSDRKFELQIFHSISGGTGSGLYQRILDQIKLSFPLTPILTYSLYPSVMRGRLTKHPMQDLNAMMAIGASIETVLSTVLDNDGLSRFAESQMGVADPTYADCNQVVAELCSHITATQRLKSDIDSGSLSRLWTSLVPYPRISFLLPKYVANAASLEDTINALSKDTSFLADSVAVNERDSCEEKMATMLFARGEGSKLQVINSLASIAETVKQEEMERGQGKRSVFKGPRALEVEHTDFAPQPYHVVHSHVPINRRRIPAEDDTGLSSFTAASLSADCKVRKVFIKISDHFDLFWAKRAFAHHLSKAGLEQGEVSERREDLAALTYDYVLGPGCCCCCEYEEGEEEDEY